MPPSPLPPLPPLTPTQGLFHALGRRNVVYIAVTLVLPLVALLIATSSYSYDRGIGIVGVLAVWVAGSGVFFAANAFDILVWKLNQGQSGAPKPRVPIIHAVIGCMLPAMLVFLVLVWVAVVS